MAKITAKINKEIRREIVTAVSSVVSLVELDRQSWKLHRYNFRGIEEMRKPYIRTMGPRVKVRHVFPRVKYGPYINSP